jgi:UDP-glucose 4-epimerase
MVCLIAGGAGFIGVNLARSLLADGHKVLAVDNFIRGDRALLTDLLSDPAFRFVEADLATEQGCELALSAAGDWGRVRTVWHLAANSDIPAGVADPQVDLRDTFLTTFELLRAMHKAGCGRLVFASSSAIYGDHGETELHEAIGPLLPISNYGAMKLASEAAISASAEAWLDQAVVLRFPNVVGAPATHGVLLDFIRRLMDEPSVLRVLGDGTQRKPYLHVEELVAAMRLADDRAGKGVSLYNVGPADEGVTVRWIAEQTVARVAPTARIEFGEGSKGWVGDVPRFRYSIAKVRDALGWTPHLGSQRAIQRAIDDIARQEGV